MKTLIEIKQNIFEAIEAGKLLDGRKDKAAITKLKKSLQFLRKAETYLMSDPDAEYIKIELDKVRRKINDAKAKGPLNMRGDLISRTKPTPEDRKRITEWDKQQGIAKMKDFQKFLTYLNS